MPIIWISVFISVEFFVPKIHSSIRIIKQMNIYTDALLCAIAMVVIRFLLGFLIFSVGKSPYDLTLRGMWLNFLTVILPFIGVELIRSYAINAFCVKTNNAFFLFIILITTFINLNIATISSIKNLEDTTKYLAQHLGPVLCMNVVLSYLALYGGANASILFRGIELLFLWFFPAIPMLNWLGEGVVGIMTPIMILYYIKARYDKRVHVSRLKSRQENKNTIEWFFSIVVSVLIIWFVVGVFPIYPTVIMTGSMKPLIHPGDVILVQKFHTEEEIKALQEGDIIVFKRDGIIISHRIQKIVIDANGDLGFITKGDNNPSEDVGIANVQDLQGKYVFAIPKVGYPTLWFKSNKIDQNVNMEN
jgi:signal peptidase